MRETELIEKTSYLLVGRYRHLFRDMFKYGFVSAFALAVDAGLLYFLVEYGSINYLSAASFGFCLGLVVNYCLAKRFVFKQSRLTSAHEFMWYASIGIVGLALNDLIIYILVLAQLWYLYAKAVSVAIVFFFNFFARRHLFAD